MSKNQSVARMTILVIKQTSLGDVLHASGHIRAIKAKYPHSNLVLLTATTSEEIYRHNPWVDEIVLIDRYEFKYTWFRQPFTAFAKMWYVMQKIRRYQFDLAIDLQGLAKSIVFLYGAKSREKYAKGYWWGIKGFKNKRLHAIAEMDEVLRLAKIDASNTKMALFTSSVEVQIIDNLIDKINPEGREILIISPFSRWPSKDWVLEKYIDTAKVLSDDYQVVITGAPDRRQEISQAIDQSGLQSVVNLAGKLNLLEFVEITSRAKLMVTGDSFPMHVASARGVPVVALFGPTDESRVGPLGTQDQVIRVSGCDICDKRNCPRKCLSRVTSETVINAVKKIGVAVS